MSLAERVHEILPDVRNAARLADEAAQADEAYGALPKASEFAELHLYEVTVEFWESSNHPKAKEAIEGLTKPDVSISDSERKELEAARQTASDKSEECKETLSALQAVVKGLRRQEISKLPESAANEIAKVISLCLHIEQVAANLCFWSRRASQAPGDTDLLAQPWAMCAIGEVLLEVLPRAPQPNLLTVAGDWIRLVEEKFLPVLACRFEGEDLSLEQLVSDLATPIVEQKCKSPEVLLALDRIAERLPDPAILRARIEPLMLFALENTPSVDSATFVRLVSRIAHRLLSGDEYKDQWPRFMKLLWGQGIGHSFNTRDFILEACSGGENDNNPDQWPEGWQREVKAFACTLSAAFWLACIYRRLGDEGREFFCSYFYQTESRCCCWSLDTWKKLAIDFGWSEVEEKEQERRFAELLPRFRASVPWPVTSVIPRVEFTPAQIESVAEAAAAKTISTLMSGGSLSEVMSSDVEPHLRQALSETVWKHLPRPVQGALIASTFIFRVQPSHFDYSGAIVLDWKALEIAIDEILFKETWNALKPEEKRFYQPPDRMKTNRKLEFLAGAIGDVDGPLQRGLRQLIEHKVPALKDWGGFDADYRFPLKIRNEAAHSRLVSKDDFERSRDFIFNVLRALGDRRT